MSNNEIVSWRSAVYTSILKAWEILDKEIVFCFHLVPNFLPIYMSPKIFFCIMKFWNAGVVSSRLSICHPPYTLVPPLLIMCMSQSDIRQVDPWRRRTSFLISSCTQTFASLAWDLYRPLTSYFKAWQSSWLENDGKYGKQLELWLPSGFAVILSLQAVCHWEHDEQTWLVMLRVLSSHLPAFGGQETEGSQRA